ncbi:YciI family protein [Actinoalloteichus spitiensis]|uniref:YciI family protein n=1 Tax=Actinoalloteichus spitiensis TaxID=252394 RepID=UPI00036B7F2C|nr:YciI family protein [Actinoalloteichus spitiensis]
MARFAVEFSYSADTETRHAARPRHRDYLAALAERGVLLAAGPWADDTGALLVYEVPDEAALREVLSADPYTPAGVITKTRVQEWTPVLGAWLAAPGS